MLSLRAIRLSMPVLAAAVALTHSGCGGAHARYENHLERGKKYLFRVGSKNRRIKYVVVA